MTKYSLALLAHHLRYKLSKGKFINNIVFVWSWNGTNLKKAFFKRLLSPEFNIVGEAAYSSNNYLYYICKCNPAVVAWLVRAYGVSHSVDSPPLQTVDPIPLGAVLTVGFRYWLSDLQCNKSDYFLMNLIWYHKVFIGYWTI